MNIRDLVRPNIRDLRPYSSARSEHSDIRGILLDANENSMGSVLSTEMNRYPDPLQLELKKSLSKLTRTGIDQIFVGNGSDEAIDLLIRAFCIPRKDKIIIFPPTYGVYSVFAATNDIAVRSVPLTESFELDSKVFNHTYTEDVKIVFICNPNNPTGNCFLLDDIKHILETTQTLVVIDEAYIDFSRQESYIGMLQEYSNLVVLQTMSKAWGMAGIRIGMAYASSEIISVLNKIKYPYNINRITQDLAVQAIANREKKDRFVKNILDQRRKLEYELKKMKIVHKVFPSRANFLLVKFQDSQKTYRFLNDKKIVVRDRSNQIHCENCLRITVGTEAENEILINTLKLLDN